MELARIQSTETSNEIKGIRTTNTSLKQLLSDKTTPRTRDEEEIAGYLDALNVIHEKYEYIPLRQIISYSCTKFCTTIPGKISAAK